MISFLQKNCSQLDIWFRDDIHITNKTTTRRRKHDDCYCKRILSISTNSLNWFASYLRSISSSAQAFDFVVRSIHSFVNETRYLNVDEYVHENISLIRTHSWIQNLCRSRSHLTCQSVKRFLRRIFLSFARHQSSWWQICIWSFWYIDRLSRILSYIRLHDAC